MYIKFKTRVFFFFFLVFLRKKFKTRVENKKGEKIRRLGSN